MRDVRNHQAIFTSLKNAITTRGGAQSISYESQRVDRVLKDTTLEVESFGFRGADGDKVSVTVHRGSQVDNRDSTTDSVHFSYGGREYESVEYPTDYGVQYSLNVNLGKGWNSAELVFAPDDNPR